MKDGKPSLISFQVENGVYIAPKIIDSAATSPSAKINYRLPGAWRGTEGRRMNQPTQPAQVQEKAPKPQEPAAEERRSRGSSSGWRFSWSPSCGSPGARNRRRQRKQPLLRARRCRRPWKSTKPKSPRCRTAFKICSASSWLCPDRTRSANALARWSVPTHDAARPSQETESAVGSGCPANCRLKTRSRPSGSERAYVSLFASNVALTYRKTPASSLQC